MYIKTKRKWYQHKVIYPRLIPHLLYQLITFHTFKFVNIILKTLMMILELLDFLKSEIKKYTKESYLHMKTTTLYYLDISTTLPSLS